MTSRIPILRRNLRASLLDAAFFSLMVGLGETYFSAFSLYLGHDQVTAGLISTIPLLAGAILQLGSPFAVVWIKSRRRWVVACATVQALSFVPLVVSAAIGHMPVIALFLFVSIYYAAGMGGGPAWSTWVETLIPRKIRTRYFARRSRWAQCATLVGFLAGGCALEYGREVDRISLTFALLFAAALICRMVSVRQLASQSETADHISGFQWVPIAKMLGPAQLVGHRQILSYLLAVQFAAYIAAPFFTPFMLSEMKLPYDIYVILISGVTTAKMLFLPLIGRITHRIGVVKMLLISGVLIVPFPALWLISQDVGYLFILQLLGGAAWAAFELASFLIFFETIPREERTSILTLYNLGNACVMVVGSMLGGAILGYANSHFHGYAWVFSLSTIARASTILLLIGVFRRFRSPILVGNNTHSHPGHFSHRASSKNMK